MAHSITYPTPGETVPVLPRGRAASMGCWQGDVGRVDAPPQGDSCALRKRWQSMLGIQSIRKIPVVERLSRQREESIVTAWGFSLTGFPTGRTDMSPTWLWHHCDLTYWLKIKAIIHRELFLLTDRSSHHGLTGTSLVIRTHRNKHRKCWMHLRWRRMKGSAGSEDQTVSSVPLSMLESPLVFGQHGDAYVLTVVSSKKGPGFESRQGRAFLCRVSFLSVWVSSRCSGFPHHQKHTSSVPSTRAQAKTWNSSLPSGGCMLPPRGMWLNAEYHFPHGVYFRHN